MTTSNKAEFDFLLTKTLEEARDKLQPQGRRVREVVRDGKSCIVTMDYDPSRINVATRDGRIIAIVNFG